MKSKTNVLVKKKGSETNTKEKIRSKDRCPECGSELIRQSGCCLCRNCGWSACEL